MRYDKTLHVLPSELAEMLGVFISTVPGSLAQEGAPRAIGRSVINGRRFRFYCRASVEAWLRAGKQQEATETQYIGQVAAPRSIPVFRPLELSDGLLANQARAAEAYQRRPDPARQRGGLQ